MSYDPTYPYDANKLLAYLASIRLAEACLQRDAGKTITSSKEFGRRIDTRAHQRLDTETRAHFGASAYDHEWAEFLEEHNMKRWGIDGDGRGLQVQVFEWMKGMGMLKPLDERYPDTFYEITTFGQDFAMGAALNTVMAR